MLYQDCFLINFIVTRQQLAVEVLRLKKIGGDTIMITRTQSFLISLAIIVLSLIFLVPRMVYPPQPVVLVNQTVTLTEDYYEAQYTLALNKGDNLNIQLSGNGDIVNIGIAQASSPSNLLVDDEDQTTVTFTWTVPQTGSYIFTVSAADLIDGATATFIVTKT